MKIAFLVSGKGDNFVLKALHSIGLWDIVVIGFDEDSSGLLYAKKKSINSLLISEGGDKQELTFNIVTAIDSVKPDVVILLFHRLLGRYYFDKVKIPTLNIHPSILPSFAGFRAIDRAIQHGVRVTGVTVHLVDESVDGGPIIIQAIQPIPQTITTYSELLPSLNNLYCLCIIQCLLWIENKQFEIINGKLYIKDAKFNQSNIYPNIDDSVYSLMEKISINDSSKTL